MLKLIALLNSVIAKAQKDHITAFSAQAAFFTVLSFFPFLIVVLSLMRCSRDAEGPDRPCELLSAGTVQCQSGCRHQLFIWKNHDNLHVIHDHHPAVVRIKRNPFHDDRAEHDPRDPGKTELFCAPVYLHYVYCVYRGSGPDRNHCALVRKHTAEPAVSVLSVSVQPAYCIFADPFRHCIFYIFPCIFYHVPFSSKRTF